LVKERRTNGMVGSNVAAAAERHQKQEFDEIEKTEESDEID
jgi:hypothetical protein